MADVDLTKIENVLNQIDSKVGGIKPVAVDEFNDGLQKVTKINSDILQKIQSMGNVPATAGTKANVSDIVSKLQTIVSHQANIDTNTGTIAGHVSQISGKIKDATEYLRLLKEHIVDGSATSTTSVSSAASASTTDSIHSTVKDILAEIKGIRNDLETKQFNSGDSELDELIKQNRRADEELKARENEEREYKKFGKITRKDASGNTLSEKEFLRQYRQEQKEEKKREEKLSGKNRAGNVALESLTETIKGFVSTEKMTTSKLADSTIGKVANMNPITGFFYDIVKSALELGSKQDRATSEFARTIGGNRQGKVNVGDTVREMIRTAPAGRGYSADAGYQAMTEVAESRGRTTERMSADALRSAIDLKRFGIGGEAINNFDTFGKSLEQTDRYFAKLYGEVSKKGLSFKNVSKAVNDNLKMAQSHTFANGLRGLERMAEKSTQLKYNMQQVFNFADKVSEVEGAISTAANLSVLGGQFAQFSNPMQMLYEGLNDTEALNDRIIGMFGGKASWDKEKGQMEMSALDREMLKQAAKAAGLDPNEMLNLSYNEGKMRHIGRQIHGVDKDTAEYIKNIAEIRENGEAYVTLNGKEKAVKDLTNADKDALEKESRAKDRGDNAKLGDVWNTTMAIGEKLDNLLQYLQEQLGRWVFGLFNRFANRENVRQNIAQGEGEDGLQTKRLNYYNEHSNEHIMGWWKGNGTRKQFAEKVANMSEAELNIDKQGSSPNGINPSRLVPGNSGMLTGPSHFRGGIKGVNRGQVWEAEGGEFLINKNSSRKYQNELFKIQNGSFNPYSYSNELISNDMKRHYQSLSLKEQSNHTAEGARPFAQNKNVSGTIKVDIPQTITINLAGANKIGDYDISGIISKYVDQFMKEAIMRRDFSGFNKEAFYNKSGVI